MLAASLQAVAGEGKKALTCVILNPKAMQIEQLYGHFDKDEWRVSNISRLIILFRIRIKSWLEIDTLGWIMILLYRMEF